MAKASLVLPAVIPSMGVRAEEKAVSSIPRLANKFRQKKLVRPLNLSYEYTQYLLKNIAEINLLRPEVVQFGSRNKPPQLATINTPNILQL